MIKLDIKSVLIFISSLIFGGDKNKLLFWLVLSLKVQWKFVTVIPAGSRDSLYTTVSNDWTNSQL